MTGWRCWSGTWQPGNEHPCASRWKNTHARRNPQGSNISPQYVEVAVHGQIGQEVHTRFDNRLARALSDEALLNRTEDFLVTQSQPSDVGAAEIFDTHRRHNGQAGGGGDRRPCFSR
jgi:hypothetical protein